VVHREHVVTHFGGAVKVNTNSFYSKIQPLHGVRDCHPFGTTKKMPVWQKYALNVEMKWQLFSLWLTWIKSCTVEHEISPGGAAKNVRG